MSAAPCPTGGAKTISSDCELSCSNAGGCTAVYSSLVVNAQITLVGTGDGFHTIDVNGDMSIGHSGLITASGKGAGAGSGDAAGAADSGGTPGPEQGREPRAL